MLGFRVVWKMIFIKCDIARHCNIIRMQVIYKISFCMRFKTNEDGWVCPSIKLLPICFESIDVTQTSENSKMRNIAWMLMQLFVR